MSTISIRPGRREACTRTMLAAAGSALVMLFIGTIGYVTGSAPSDAVPAPPHQVRLESVPGGIAAVSAQHGPHTTRDGRASGFTHDELGAAIAASNLAPRVSAAAPAIVYEATMREQTWGDTGATLQQLRAALPASDAAPTDELSATALYYRVLAGDPRGEHVVVSLLADTPQARSRGGLARVDAALRWAGGDWQLRVPPRQPSLHPDTAGHTLLGPTP